MTTGNYVADYRVEKIVCPDCNGVGYFNSIKKFYAAAVNSFNLSLKFKDLLAAGRELRKTGVIQCGCRKGHIERMV